MPVGDVLVGDAGGDVEHNDTALALDVVAVTEATELLLTRGIPDVEADRAEVRGEGESVDLDTEGGYKARWRNQHPRAENRAPRRDCCTYQCTSSRIHQSSDAVRRMLISTRSRAWKGARMAHTLTKVVLPVPPSLTVSPTVISRQLDDLSGSRGGWTRNCASGTDIDQDAEQEHTVFIRTLHRPVLNREYAPRTSLKVGIVDWSAISNI